MALITLLTTCREPGGGPTEGDLDQKTTIVFDNTHGICTAVVYDDYRRRDEDKIAEIPPGTSSREIEWAPGKSVPFYFSYRINFKGISGFTLNYTPKEVGKDQTAVRIDANKKTTIKIPKLDETVSSPDTILSDNSFLLIQNNYSFSFQLYRGNSSVSPDGLLNSAVVNSGERAQYTITTGEASNYRLLVGADYIPFPGSLVSFEAGRVYSFVYSNGVLSLISEVELKLENIETPGAPDIPGRPVLIAGYREIAVSWQAVELAESYEVWFGTSVNSAQAEKFGGDITGGVTETIITGLTNETTYYVWIKAKNVVGTSGFSLPASAKPYTVDRLPGLYRGNVKIGNYNLSSSLSYISTHAVSGDNYFIILGEDESVSPKNLNYSGKTVGITLIGYGGERKITLNANGSMLTINTGVTLTIEKNISLVGRSNNTASLISLNTGELIINDGAKINGNTSISNGSSGTGGLGGGIYVDGGTVTMNGGVINGNTASGKNGYGGVGGGIYNDYANGGTVTINGGEISGNTATSSGNASGGAYGGGVYGSVIMNGGVISKNTVSGGGTYGNRGGGIYGTVTMIGGTISGNIAREGGGIFGTVTMNGGIISGNSATNGGGIYVTNQSFKKPPSNDGQNSGIIYGSDETGFDTDGAPLKNTANNSNSHAVFYQFYRDNSPSLSRMRNTTAGQTDYIDTETGRGLSVDGEPPYGE
jgi:hypothetical protein